MENIVEVAPTEEEKAEHRFSVAEYYKNINKDYVGYLELSGCDIADPVVKGEDNEYYLTHSVRGGTIKRAAIFMDYRCTSATTTFPRTLCYTDTIRKTSQCSEV